MPERSGLRRVILIGRPRRSRGLSGGWQNRDVPTPAATAEPVLEACGAVSRAFVVVLDACGVGALPDPADYGDAGANTLGHLATAAGGLQLPTLEQLGLGSIIPLEGVPPAAAPVLHGALHPLGPGKDSTAGHWELMGVVAPSPMPTYPRASRMRSSRSSSRRADGGDVQPPVQRDRGDR